MLHCVNCWSRLAGQGPSQTSSIAIEVMSSTCGTSVLIGEGPLRISSVQQWTVVSMTQGSIQVVSFHLRVLLDCVCGS